MTSICGSLERTSLRDWRTTAESSTISTPILLRLIAQPSPFWLSTRIRYFHSAPSTQPDESYLSVSGIEADLPPKCAANAAGQRPTYPSSANIWIAASEFSLPTVGRAAAWSTKIHIGAAKDLHLDFRPQRAQTVELRCQAVNAEVHVPVANREH